MGADSDQCAEDVGLERTDAAVFAAFGRLTCGGALGCARDAQKSSTAAVTALATNKRRSGVGQFQFLLPVHDRTGFDKHRGHARVAQHDELIVAIDAAFGVEQRVAVTPH